MTEKLQAINLNDSVLVKLTDKGRQALTERDNALLPAHPGVKLGPAFSEDGDGFSKWQIWSLIADLGKEICMGLEPPFETTIYLAKPNPLSLIAKALASFDFDKRRPAILLASEAVECLRSIRQILAEHGEGE